MTTEGDPDSAADDASSLISVFVGMSTETVAACPEAVSAREEVEGALVEMVGTIETPLGVISCNGTCP
jgi:hypothetical protein